MVNVALWSFIRFVFKILTFVFHHSRLGPGKQLLFRRNIVLQTRQLLQNLISKRGLSSFESGTQYFSYVFLTIETYSSNPSIAYSTSSVIVRELEYLHRDDK